jgi:hypothetical protein
MVVTEKVNEKTEEVNERHEHMGVTRNTNNTELVALLSNPIVASGKKQPQTNISSISPFSH